MLRVSSVKSVYSALLYSHCSFTVLIFYTSALNVMDGVGEFRWILDGLISISISVSHTEFNYATVLCLMVVLFHLTFPKIICHTLTKRQRPGFVSYNRLAETILNK